jgi:hypothetical protein
MHANGARTNNIGITVFINAFKMICFSSEVND